MRLRQQQLASRSKRLVVLEQHSASQAGLLTERTRERLRRARNGTAARFLRNVLVPFYRQAGWPIQRLLTDRGSEFRGDFDKACSELRLPHTRTKPGHARTNGFVERLQGHHPARALARGVPLPLLHPPRAAPALARWLPAAIFLGANA